MDAGQMGRQPEASQWGALPTSVYLRLCPAGGEEAPGVSECVCGGVGGALLSQSRGDGEGSTQRRD